MKTLKLLLLAVLMTTTTVALADNPTKRGKSVTYEIEQMLKNSNLLIEDDLKVNVFFTLSEDNRIVVKYVRSENEKVAQFLTERLNNKKVHGQNWDQNKLYELPVRIQG